MEDHSHYKPRNSNPRENANLLSAFTLYYTFPTFFYGYRKNITEDDIYETFSELKSSNLGNSAIELWKNECKYAMKNKTKPSLQKLIIKMLVWEYLLISAGVAIMEGVARPLQIYFLGKLISCYSESEKYSNPLIYSMGIIVCTSIIALLMHPVLLGSYSLALKARVILGSLIYRKILKLSKTALAQTTAGQILNLISNDINVFDKIVFTSQYLWAGPLQTTVLLWLMYREVGVSSFFGMALLLTFMPLYFILGNMATKYRLKTSVRRDHRLRLMNEIIQGINVIKMYAWEKSFSEMIASIRKLEVHSITIGLYIKCIYLVFPTFGVAALFVTVISSALLNEVLSAKSMFITSTLITLLSGTLNFLIPQGMIFLNESSVASNRIANFLLCEESQLVNVPVNGNNAITIQHGAATWDNSTSQHFFSNLNFEIENSSLTAIIGPVGSGKSSLLNIVLGEMLLITGDLRVNGSISYASQEPWIFSSTIRQNIVFGSRFDDVRYNKVIRCCALERDLKLFPYGDKTTVGEKGTSLSGGQKARISLARAIYRKADIYLLDDPLSAVDTQVGKQIFEQCIQTFLKGKTVVLVTHQLQYLKYVNYIIVLNNASVVAKGIPSELETSGFDLAKYLAQSFEKVSDDKIGQIELVQNVEDKKETSGTATGRKFIAFDTYKDYFFASKSYILVATPLLCFVLAQAAISFSHYFLAYWVNDQEHEATLKNNENRRNLFIYVYTGIIGACILLTFLRSVYFVKLTMKSSKILHDTMFKNVVYATLNFFHSNSSGLILNRFAKDLAAVDEMLPNCLMITLRTILDIIGVFCVICFANPWFLVPTIILVLTLHFLRVFYLATNLNILRVEGQVRGPLYGYVNTSLQGLSTIRAFKMQKSLTKEFYGHQDLQSSAMYMSLTTSRAFAYWLDIISVIYITILTMYYTFNSDSYGANVGLVISQAMQLIGHLPWGVRQITDVENLMISIERISEYNAIRKEQNIKSLPDKKPPSSWPNRGEIKFTNVSLRYSQTTPYVLNNLNFIIRPLEKVGIVGRTGAGKSSIIAALFQLIEVEGLIVIDQIDIRTIGLHDLRLRMSIIPQDPVLFTGSIRNNLDPFDEYEDEALWKALEEVRLKSVVDNLASGLSFEISQDGSNFSVGQRQLICLARAIVRNNKILILDEATANVDLDTDVIIQETIRRKFCNCTVLTVAHRLNTIMDSDKVLVMDTGIAVEFDHPYLLLQNKNGHFYNLVQQTEKAMADTLMDIAKKSYEKSS